jgi:hypothetical protein
MYRLEGRDQLYLFPEGLSRYVVETFREKEKSDRAKGKWPAR